MTTYERRCNLCVEHSRFELNLAAERVAKDPSMRLFEAIHQGHFDVVVTKLKSESGELKSPDRTTGRNCLHACLATTNCGPEARYQMAALLLEAGCSPNAGTLLGRERPLHFACHLDEKKIVEMLLCYGADVEGRNRMGRSPIFYARSPDVAHVLIREGARYDDTDTTGGTPHGAALERSDETMAHFWEQYAQRRVRDAESKAKRAAEERAVRYAQMTVIREANVRAKGAARLEGQLQDARYGYQQQRTAAAAGTGAGQSIAASFGIGSAAGR